MTKLATYILLVCAAAASAFGAAQPWASPAEAAAQMQELQSFLQGAETRYPGSPGNRVMEDRMDTLFAESGLKHGDIKFQTACFIPGDTSLAFSNHPPVRLHPMHPTMFRPGNFKEKEFTASCVYLGNGSNADLERIKGTPLENTVVLMEFNCGTEWMRLLRFGVKGFIFIEPDRYERNDALAKVYNTEVAIPRFWVNRADGAALKAVSGRGTPVALKAQPSRWENKALRDLWVLIPGADPDLKHEVAVLVAPLDSNCIVPDLAFGAQSGANLFCLAKILADFKRQPPARSTLLVAVNAHVLAYEGERVLAWHMLASETAVERLRDTLNNDLRIQQTLARHYRQLKLTAYDPADEALLLKWRSFIDESAGKNITVKQPLVALAKRDINRLKNEQMILFQQDLPGQEKTRRQKELEARRQQHVNILTLFNKVGIRTTLRDLSGEEVRILKSYVDEVVRFNETCATLNAQDLQQGRTNDVIREVLRGDKVAFVISLGMDWSSPEIGFLGEYPANWVRRWGANTVNIAKDLEVRMGRNSLLTDTLTLRAGHAEPYYFGEKMKVPGSQPTAGALFRSASQTPAFDLWNTFSADGNAFLPADNFAALGASHFAAQLSFLLPYLRDLLCVRQITDSSELVTSEVSGNFSPMSAIQLKTFKFDEFSASVVPELPVPDTAVIINVNDKPATGIYKWPRQADLIYADVCTTVAKLTDPRAATIVYGLTMPIYWSSAPPFAPAAFHFDPDFVTVDHAIDCGDAQKKMSSDDLYKNVTLTLFECSELPIYPVADSSLISSSHTFTEFIAPLTAKGNTSPHRYGLGGIKSLFSKKAVRISAGAPAAYYPAPTQRTKFITFNKRTAIHATEKEYEGIGYGTAEEMGPDFFRNVAQDLSILNRARIRKLKDVANQLVHEFADRGDRCLASVNSALTEHDYLRYLRSLYEGIGAQVKSYEQAKQTSDDMLKAVVIYMALLLPFCFFIEKLMFNFVKIEHEMAAFAGLFVTAFVVFRNIHPAFRVAQAAEAIFIAFIMGALGLFVISILRSRFEGEMQLIFRSYLSGTTDQAAYSTVTQKAMLIGVNNMKRRRVRTLLTTLTIVLIAFAMLSFTSISKKVNPTVVRKSGTPPYTGLMLSWPGKSQMDEATYEVVRDLFGPYGQVVERRWKVTGGPFQVNFNQGQETSVDAVLGLTKAENGFLGSIPLVAGRFFSSDAAHEALISEEMAANLGINPARLPGLRLACSGVDLEVVGVYDDEKIKNLKDLNGVPLLPIKRVSQAVGGFGMEVEVQDELDALGTLFFVDPLALVIAPSETVRRMGGFPYSVSVKMEDEAPVWPLMDTLLTSTMAKFYMGSLKPFAIGERKEKATTAGTYYIGSNYKTSVGGLAILLVPLLIAATIILNTMLGSVYERKKEIAIYNAIGLNPHHIGLFFLAESFVYGVIGSVGGYLIGQLLSLGVSYTGWVKGLNFNYSSLSVAYVILFTIAIVLLSTLYPAMAAVRTAVPSGKRTWSMPAHKDNRMEIVFPFIYQPHIAPGVLAYLTDYFANFTEVSVGDLIATLTALDRAKDDKGRDRFHLDYHIALVPYDLGVTEDLKFNLFYDDEVQAYRLVLLIDRVSGQDVNWITTNRPFLERLRKYLMRWRNLDLAQQTLYVKQSEAALRRTS